MGLDAVELIMRYEETFGVDIPDKDAEGILTPAEMVEYLETRLGTAAGSDCLQQRAFYLLRRTANEALTFPRKQFRPDTQLQSLGFEEAEKWGKLRDAVGAHQWPELPRSRIGRALKNAFGPFGPKNVRDLVAFLIREPSLVGAPQTWTRERIRCAVREVTLEYVRSIDYREEARYVRDMHLG